MRRAWALRDLRTTPTRWWIIAMPCLLGTAALLAFAGADKVSEEHEWVCSSCGGTLYVNRRLKWGITVSGERWVRSSSISNLVDPLGDCRHVWIGGSEEGLRRLAALEGIDGFLFALAMLSQETLRDLVRWHLREEGNRPWWSGKLPYLATEEEARAWLDDLKAAASSP